MFARLGRWCHDRRWVVLILWIAGLFVANGILAGVGGAETNADFSLPDVESRRGTDILEDSFGGQGAGFGGTVVFLSQDGVADPEVQQTMEAVFADFSEMDGVASVVSPYSQEGARQIATEGQYEGQIAYAQVDMDPDIGEADLTDLATEARDRVDEIDQAGLQVELGGQTFAEFAPPASELLGVAFAIVILILAFGSVLAMGLPIGVAVAGIAAGTTVAGFLSFLVSPPSFAQIFGLMIGLGVGIDYALFIVTRFRENLHRGQDVRSAVATAIDTAGRAVIFAGTTVVISMLGMILIGLSFITGMAIAIATVVAATMLASVTLLPALLSLAKQRVEITRWGGLVAAAFVAVGLIGAGLEIAPVAGIGFGIAAVLVLYLVAAWLLDRFVLESGTKLPLRGVVKRRPPKDLRETTAYRWSRLIQHHPWPAAIGGAVVLLVLTVPLAGLRLGFSDEGNYATDTTTRKAYDLLADGFGLGHNGPLMMVSELPEGGGVDDQELDGLGADIVDLETQAAEQEDREPGIASISPPMLSDSGDAAAWQVIPTTSPQNEATTDLVNRLRDELLPAATEGTELDVAVSGTVPIQVDFAGYLAERLVYFLGAVLVLSFLLLMVVFRSLLVPLKAVIMNLLSIGAAYGVMVAGFQWGWLGGILNFEAAPIEPWMPMMLFAIVFGLSMDYEVFLLSRVKEEWLRTGDSRTSVADGLAATARVITAAALIMVFVFGAFLFEPDRVVKLMGVGLATAVLLDATIVRMLLVPATMELLGDGNWWLPRWLDRLLPNIDVEGHDTADEEPGGQDAERQLERV